MATLAQRLEALLADRAVLQAMAERARAASQPESLQRIVDVCLEVAA